MLKNILFASLHTYIPFRSGGLESSTHEMGLALRSTGARVSVLSAQTELAETSNLGSAQSIVLDRDLGYDVYRAASPADALKTIVHDTRVTTIVLHAERNMSLFFAALATGVTTIVCIRDVEFGHLSWRFNAYPNVRYIANSSFVATRSALLYGIQCVVIPPLVIRKQYQVDSSRQKVLFVNPLPKKGVEIAFSLARDLCDIQFDFVESWPTDELLLQSYRDRARPLSNISWHSRREDMRTLYRTAKLALVPSVWEEGWGRIVSEAQISGIPSLASHRGGLPESVGSGGVLVHPVENFETWKEYLRLIWTDVSYYDNLVKAANEYSHRPEFDEHFILAQFLRITD